MKKQNLFLCSLLFAVGAFITVISISANNSTSFSSTTISSKVVDENQLEKLRKSKKELEKRLAETDNVAQKATLQKKLDQLNMRIVSLEESAPTRISRVDVVVPENKYGSNPQVDELRAKLLNQDPIVYDWNVKSKSFRADLPESKRVEAPLTLEQKIEKAKTLTIDPNANSQDKAKAQKMLDGLKIKSEQRLSDSNVSQEKKIEAQEILDLLNK